MKLFKWDPSPPARACVMACELLGLNIEIVEVDVVSQEHRTPEYLQLNPARSVPVLIDDDVVIHDSHAILMYLADVYGKDDSLYPKDPKKRALVNQKLFFEAANLYSLLRKTILTSMDSQKKLTQKQKDEFTETYSFLEAFLSRSEYIAGNNMTIADVSAITSVTGLNYILPIDSEKYPKTAAWIRIMEGKPFYKCNENVPYQLKIATKLARDNFTGRFTMTMKLYKRDVSPPARACVMACELFGLNIEIIEIDELKKEHLTPEYLRLNPVHTVPVLIDGDVVVHDSHAILMYLADVYGKDDSLYPKDPKKRALVNQKLFFEAANLFSLMRKTIYRFIDYGETKLTQKQKDEFADTYSFLQEFLSRTDYIAGNNMTIADVSAITSVTALSYIVPIDSEKYPKIGPWMRKMEGKPFYKCNENGSKSLGQWLQRTFEL